MFKQPWFWAAVAAIVALLSFLFTHLIGKKRLRYWTLQRLINRERSFYATLPMPCRAPQNNTEQYLSSVAQSLAGFDLLPPELLKDAKVELRRLLDNLRATHQTLVSALEHFSLTDASKFFEEFDQFSARFATLYHGGQIPHNARTHCHEIEAVISEIDLRLQGGIPPGWHQISTLRHSLVVEDNDVIIPLMVNVLECAQFEISIIGQAIRSRDFRKAVYVKERFWFETSGDYRELNASLTKMSTISVRI